MKLQTKSGKLLHPIGIGTWGFGGMWETDDSNDQEAIDAIQCSIANGQNHIDTAQIYGQGHTDELVGEAIKGTNREDLFIATKLWETHVTKGKVREAVEMMLKKYGTDYLDALYIHKAWENIPWREALPQIDELIDEGLVRYFAVSNFNLDHLRETTKAMKHPITLNQIHYNVLNREAYDADVKAFCSKHDIQMVAYKPLERGAVLENEVVKKIAKAQGVTPSQIALAWLVQEGFFAIPKAENEGLIKQSVEAANIVLTKDDIEKLSAVAD